MSTPDEKIWQTTAVQNLVRYAPSGTYFARFRVAGRLVWKSLKTTAFSVAKQRLPDTMRDHRAKLESGTAFAKGKMTFAAATEVYLQKVQASVSLKPRSKEYRGMMIDFIRRSWPSLFDADVRKVSQRDCENWLTKYQQQYSPTRARFPMRDAKVRVPEQQSAFRNKCASARVTASDAEQLVSVRVSLDCGRRSSAISSALS